MSFIGRDGRPAPKLKDAQMSSAELELAYEGNLRTFPSFMILMTLFFIF